MAGNESLLAFDFSMAAICLVFLLLRLYVRVVRLRKFGISDGLVCFAWGLLFLAMMSDWILWKWGFWDPKLTIYGKYGLPDFEKVVHNHNTLRPGLIIYFIVPMVTVTIMYSVKFSFLFLYRQIFPPQMKKLRIALNAAFVFILTAYLTTLSLNIFLCHPVSSNWTLVKDKRCMSVLNINRYLFSISMTLTTDVIVYTLPFFLLPTLYRNSKTSRRELAWCAAVMSIGLLPIVCGVSRIAGTYAGIDAWKASLFGSAEVATSVLVACCPPLRHLFTRRKRARVRHPKAWTSTDRAEQRVETKTAWRFWRMGGWSTERSENRTITAGTMYTATAASGTGNGVSFFDEKDIESVGGLAPVPRRHSSATTAGMGMATRANSKQSVDSGIGAGILAMITRRKSSDKGSTSLAPRRTRTQSGGNTFGGPSQATPNASEEKLPEGCPGDDKNASGVVSDMEPDIEDLEPPRRVDRSGSNGTLGVARPESGTLGISILPS